MPEIGNVRWQSQFGARPYGVMHCQYSVHGKTAYVSQGALCGTQKPAAGKPQEGTGGLAATVAKAKRTTPRGRRTPAPQRAGAPAAPGQPAGPEAEGLGAGLGEATPLKEAGQEVPQGATAETREEEAPARA